MASMDTRAIEGEIDRIRSLGLEKLRREWRRLNHGEPPRISRDLLILALGYRLQEIAHGGLGKATRRKLQTMAKALRTTGRVGPTPSLSLKPGARLVREWGGRTHTVTVTEDGFEYAGTSYPSLTKIAKKITGAHWSGPRFFGLLAQRGLMVSNESIRRWVLKFGPIIAKNLREICGAHADLIGRECLQQLFLFGCRGRVDPLVEGQSSAISREIGNLTPADVYFGRGQTILIEGVVKGGSTMTQGVALVAVTDAVTALAERVNVDVGLVIAPELREVTGNVL